MQFEWDERKAARNLQKHGIRFEIAARVFFDPNLTIRDDDRFDYGERRFIAIGAVEEHLLAVVFTEPFEDTIRIVSARKATRNERDSYRQSRD